MTKQDAINSAEESLHLIGKKFRLPDGETETVKAVVAWEENPGDWQPHVCFYDWGEHNPDGHIAHLNVHVFKETYHPVETNERGSA
jgi:hypothetical protein